MNLKIILLYISFLILLKFCHQTNAIDTNKSCLIHNLHYSHEYLYAQIMTKNDNRNFTPNVFTYPLDKVENFTKITWMFMPLKVNDIQIIYLNRKVYLIKSGDNEHDYLCSTDFHSKISPKRRILRLFKITDNDKLKYQKCFWTLQLKDESKNEYIIRNMNGESMYAASFFFNAGWFKRSVYLWASKDGFNSKKSKWIIDCSKGEFIYSK